MAGKLFKFGVIFTTITIALIFIAVMMTNYATHEKHSGLVFSLSGLSFLAAIGCWISYWTIKIKLDAENDGPVSQEEYDTLKSKQYG